MLQFIRRYADRNMIPFLGPEAWQPFLLLKQWNKILPAATPVGQHFTVQQNAIRSIWMDSIVLGASTVCYQSHFYGKIGLFSDSLNYSDCLGNVRALVRVQYC